MGSVYCVSALKAFSLIKELFTLGRVCNEKGEYVEFIFPGDVGGVGNEDDIVEELSFEADGEQVLNFCTFDGGARNRLHTSEFLCDGLKGRGGSICWLEWSCWHE